MDNLHEDSEWNNERKTEKKKLPEWTTKKDLNNLWDAVIYWNRATAEKYLKALEESIWAPKDKKKEIVDIPWYEVAEGKQNRVSITPHLVTSHNSHNDWMGQWTSIWNKIIPTWFKWVILWSTESMKVIIGSVKKFTLDLLLFPYDLYIYFKNKRKKIG
jgi:hypothetical protein